MAKAKFDDFIKLVKAELVGLVGATVGTELTTNDWIDISKHLITLTAEDMKDVLVFKL